MRILVASLNYAPEEIGIAVYSTGMCTALAAAGNEVRVVAGHPYYPEWRIRKGRRGLWRHTREDGVDIIRCPHYVPAHPSGLKRIIHLASFAASAMLPLFFSALRFRPDVVVAIAPSLIAAPVAAAAARVGRARPWLHIQDFEVEAAVATGLLGANSRAAQLAMKFQHWCFARFDRISSISPEMCRKLTSSGVPESKIVEFRNWARIDAITPMTSPSPFRARWSIDTPHVALYSGNIANKQGIEIVIDAARRLAHRDDLTFVICGQGPYLPVLKKQAAGLSNLQFHDLQPFDQLNDLLGLASVHLLSQKADAADLVLPSKLANMLASGRPIIATAAPDTALARELAGCGYITPPENAEAFAGAIEDAITSPATYDDMAVTARRRAEEVWDRSAILGGFVAHLTELIQHPPRERAPKPPPRELP